MTPDQVNGIHCVMIYHFKGADENGNGGVEVVVAHAPEDAVSISIAPKWGQTGLGKAIEGVTNTLNQGLSAITGVQLRSPLTSAQSYQGTDPPRISMTLQFNAEYDARREVLEPIGKLLNMCVPEIRNNLQVSIPGPTVGDAVAQMVKSNTSDDKQIGESISVYIGSSQAWTNMVIDSMDVKLGTNIGHDGIPLSASVTLAFKPFMSPYRADIKRTLGITE